MSDEERLERAIAALRAEVPVRAEWRATLEQQLAQAPVPLRQRQHGWHVSPVMAIAAALVCMAGGAALNQLLHTTTNSAGSASAAALSSTATPVTAQYAANSSNAVGVRFSVLAPHVRRVSLVGDFNGWDADATPLQLARDGQTWTTMLPLSSGRHAYAFVIDGAVVRDPTAPAAPDEDFGVPNSLLLVSAVR